MEAERDADPSRNLVILLCRLLVFVFMLNCRDHSWSGL